MVVAGALRALKSSRTPSRQLATSLRDPVQLLAPSRQGYRRLVDLARARPLQASPYQSPPTGHGAESFSSSACAHRSESESSLPLDDVPLVKNPTPEQTLDVFEGLARTQYEEPIKGLYSTPSQYCAAIVRTTRILSHFLATVDKDEFRSGKEVAPDSPIARGRAALMLTARTAHRWMQEAYPQHAPPSDADVGQAMMYFAMNDKLMDIYEAGAPDPVPEWQDICDAILLAYFYALPTLEKIAGPMPEELKVYSADISKLDKGPGEEGRD
ncbi:hypothetical protein DAEQUDRAFT_720801 [Daedalea quercina L-15889]|uniref:Uncharacterized protein n=1 Tax=Daedalea quercina L-15889 TaxID=1314783 RepID=A0A165U9S1_9APHY|nr:hypothetical protein DAEQUDRAFT_720801 [Daedalea quercina L-15889]